MKKMGEENFKKNWEETRRENRQMDDLTDARIRSGIQRKIRAGRNFRKIYWAAAAAVIIGFGFIFYTPSSPAKPVEAAKIQMYSSADFTKHIYLPDGSSVVMEPHSTVELSSDFGKTDRKIIFTGKATFDIAKDKARPFRINAKDFTVQVLGTKFFLDQTSGKQKVELFEGKVKIDHKGKITYLLPNEIWEQNVKRIEKQYFAADEKRDFSFNDENFENIISEVEQVYHVKIEYPQQYGKRKIKGFFSGNLDEVLSAICYPFNLKTVQKSEKEIQLK